MSIKILFRALIISHTLLASWMLICKLGQVVHIFIYDDIEIICCLMRRNICGRESLRHFEKETRCSCSGSSGIVQEAVAVTRQTRPHETVDL